MCTKATVAHVPTMETSAGKMWQTDMEGPIRHPSLTLQCEAHLEQEILALLGNQQESVDNQHGMCWSPTWPRVSEDKWEGQMWGRQTMELMQLLLLLKGGFIISFHTGLKPNHEPQPFKTRNSCINSTVCLTLFCTSFLPLLSNHRPHWVSPHPMPIIHTFPLVP